VTFCGAFKVNRNVSGVSWHQFVIVFGAGIRWKV